MEFFYSVRDEEEETIEMAYVRHLRAAHDGPLWCLAGGFAAVEGGGLHKAIKYDDIVGLAGLLKGGRAGGRRTWWGRKGRWGWSSW